MVPPAGAIRGGGPSEPGLSGRDSFVWSASHDDREPLDDEGRGMLGMLRDSSARMDALIVSLSAWARADRVEPRAVRVDLADRVREVLADVTPLLHEARATVRVEGGAWATADDTLVHQILQNLVTNAIRYGRPGVPPVIAVSVQTVGDHVEIDVVDNGRGFPDGRLDDAFRPFRRLVADGEGTGLGLALARRLARRMAGDVRVAATGPTGSVVRVVLPRAGAVD